MHTTVIHLFFFNDTATTEIYTLSLHDALPISEPGASGPPDHPGDPEQLAGAPPRGVPRGHRRGGGGHHRDRKSTRLNSSHGYISYAVFCLKKKRVTAATTRLQRNVPERRPVPT